MLGGIDPIIIIQFSKLAPSVGQALAKIPLVANNAPGLIAMPPIPIYLNENLTGIYIDAESKNVDIDTDVETKTDGSDPNITQKGLSSTVDINLFGKKTSLGLILLSSLVDIIFEKASSKEYSISYLHGPVTIFQAVLHSFVVDQNSQNDLLTIKMQISKGSKSPVKGPDVPIVSSAVGATPL
jgi:hypothetical protein